MMNSNTASGRRIEWNWLSVCWFPLPLKEKGYSRPSPPGRPTDFDGHEWADESRRKQVRLIGLAIPPKYLPGNFARSLPPEHSSPLLLPADQRSNISHDASAPHEPRVAGASNHTVMAIKRLEIHTGNPPTNINILQDRLKHYCPSPFSPIARM